MRHRQIKIHCRCVMILVKVTDCIIIECEVAIECSHTAQQQQYIRHIITNYKCCSISVCAAERTVEPGSNVGEASRISTSWPLVPCGHSHRQMSKLRKAPKKEGWWRQPERLDWEVASGQLWGKSTICIRLDWLKC